MSPSPHGREGECLLRLDLREVLGNLGRWAVCLYMGSRRSVRRYFALPEKRDLV